MSKVKVNQLSKHDALEITVNDDLVLASGKSVSSPSISTDTISEKTTSSGVTIDGVLIKDGQVDGVDVSTITDTNTIKQVVYRESTLEYNRSNTTLAAANDFHVLITPTSTTNKIYVEASMDCRNVSNTDGGYALWYKSTDGGTTYSALTNSASFFYATGNGHRQHYMNFHDTAGTTNEIRYQMYIRSWGGGSMRWNYRALSVTEQLATFTAMEYSV